MKNKIICEECGELISKNSKRCPNCGLEFGNNALNSSRIRKMNKKFNTVANIIKAIAILNFASSIGIILNKLFDSSSMNTEAALTYAGVVFVIFIFTYAIAEIIQILHDIRRTVINK